MILSFVAEKIYSDKHNKIGNSSTTKTDKCVSQIKINVKFYVRHTLKNINQTTYSVA